MNSKNLNFIFIAVVSTVVLSSLFINWIFLVAIIIPFFFVWKFKIDFKTIILSILISCGICVYVFCFYKVNILSWIPNPLINKLNSFIDSHYDEKTSSLMEIILLNEKRSESSWTIYYEIKDMSLVYLISIGGLQFSMFSIFLKKIIKSKKVNLIVSIIFFTFYSYLLGFPPALLRVVLSTIIRSFSFKTCKNVYSSLALTLLISLIIVPSQITNIGFYLTYGCTFIVILIYSELDTNNFFKYLIMNLSCTLFSIPFVISFDNQINLLFLLTSYPYGMLMITLFFWYFFTWPFTFMANFQNDLSNIIFNINEYLSSFRIMIYI